MLLSSAGGALKLTLEKVNKILHMVTITPAPPPVTTCEEGPAGLKVEHIPKNMHSCTSKIFHPVGPGSLGGVPFLSISSADC